MGCASSSNEERIIRKVSLKTKENKEDVRTLYRGFKKLCPKMKMSPELFVAYLLSLNDQVEDPHPFLVMFMAKLFRAFDEDNNGVMDFEEFATFLHTLTAGEAGDILQAVFKVIDSDKSGTIEEDEFISTVVYLAAFNTEDVDITTLMYFVLAEDVFEKVDKDKSGTVDQGEFLNALLNDTTDGMFSFLVGLVHKSMTRILTANPPIPKITLTVNIVTIRIEVEAQRSKLENDLQDLINKK